MKSTSCWHDAAIPGNAAPGCIGTARAPSSTTEDTWAPDVLVDEATEAALAGSGAGGAGSHCSTLSSRYSTTQTSPLCKPGDIDSKECLLGTQSAAKKLLSLSASTGSDKPLPAKTPTRRSLCRCSVDAAGNR